MEKLCYHLLVLLLQLMMQTNSLLRETLKVRPKISPIM
jgi:hypothetical protein